MLIIISPAKKLLEITTPFQEKTTHPQLMAHTEQLVHIMKSKSNHEIAKLMSLSNDLAQLNYDRYQSFQLEEDKSPTQYPAIFLFQGDVYQGLKAQTFNQEDLDFAQNHLAILSGLYGLLRPLDSIQPYRLEMGTRLASARGANLYHFWGNLITQQINHQLSLQENPVLINLASEEYFKSIKIQQLENPLLTINFYEKKNNQIKMVGIYSKKARGLMAAYIIKNKINAVDEIKSFQEEGYRFNEVTSNDKQLDFIREHS